MAIVAPAIAQAIEDALERVRRMRVVDDHQEVLPGFYLLESARHAGDRAERRRDGLARDRVGIKPVYYYQSAKALWFASELKSILCDSTVPRDICLPAVRQFLSFYYSPGDATLLRSIKKLLPGHYLVAEKGDVTIGRITKGKEVRD